MSAPSPLDPAARAHGGRELRALTSVMLGGTIMERRKPVLRERTHTGERPYVGGGAGAAKVVVPPRRKAAKRARDNDEAEEARSYMCEVCHAAYARKQGLGRHMLSHIGEAPRGVRTGLAQHSSRKLRLREEAKLPSRHVRFMLSPAVAAGRFVRVVAACGEGASPTSVLVHAAAPLGPPPPLPPPPRPSVRSYKCGVCSEAFVYEANLPRHQRRMGHWT